MKCKNLQDLLSAYADGELSQEQRNLVESHLAQCTDCRIILEGFQTVNDRLLSRKVILETKDIKELTVRKIEAFTVRKQPVRWLRPALVGVPVVVVMILLAVLQPWTPIGGGNSTSVMAMEQLIEKVNLATTFDGLHSCRITAENPIAPVEDKNISYLPGIFEFEWVLPNDIHLQVKTTPTGKVNEFVINGSATTGFTTYSLIENDVPYKIDYWTAMNISRGVPRKNVTLQFLKSMTGVEQSPDEEIEGVVCLHYKGISGGFFYTLHDVPVQLWIGKDDLIIRQVVYQLPESVAPGIVSKLKYWDFNVPLVQDPISASGSLLPGWQKTYQELNQSVVTVPVQYILDNDTVPNPYYAKVTFPTKWLYEPPKENEWGGSGSIWSRTFNFAPGRGFERYPLWDYESIDKLIEEIPYDSETGIPAIMVWLFTIDIGEENTTAFFPFTDPGFPKPDGLFSGGIIIKIPR